MAGIACTSSHANPWNPRDETFDINYVWTDV